MLDLNSWKAELRLAVATLEANSDQLLGFQVDPGSNFVAEAPAGRPVVDTDGELAAFYAEVGEVSLPDVFVGYFIHPGERLAVASDWGLPSSLRSADEPIATFGSDGGGELFCVHRPTGSVLRLPNRSIENGTYLGPVGSETVLAPDLSGFLSKFLAAAQEFVTTGHTSAL